MAVDLSDLIGTADTTLGNALILTLDQAAVQEALARLIVATDEPPVTEAMSRVTAAILSDPGVTRALRLRALEAGAIIGGLVFLGVWLGRRD